MYAADATVTGDPALLRRDPRLQLRRFFAGVRGTAAHAGNFGPGLRFHDLPDRTVNAHSNVDTAEYANIMLSFTWSIRRPGTPGCRRSRRARARSWASGSDARSPATGRTG